MKELLGIIIFFAVIIAGAVWLPGVWHARELERTTQSSIMDLKDVAIESVGKEESRVADDMAQAEGDTTAKNETPLAPATDPAKLVIKVLNGGAAGGSAGKLAQVLRSAGFKLVTAGDSKSDYAGVTVYYQSAGKADADAVKATLTKAYPSVEERVETDMKKETASAAIVVVVGK